VALTVQQEAACSKEYQRQQQQQQHMAAQLQDCSQQRPHLTVTEKTVKAVLWLRLQVKLICWHIQRISDAV
jgi:hypothetical protein